MRLPQASRRKRTPVEGIINSQQHGPRLFTILALKGHNPKRNMKNINMCIKSCIHIDNPCFQWLGSLLHLSLLPASLPCFPVHWPCLTTHLSPLTPIAAYGPRGPPTQATRSCHRLVGALRAANRRRSPQGDVGRHLGPLLILRTWLQA